MTNRITITLTLDIPEGLIPDVIYGDTPAEPPDLYVAPPPVYDKDAIARPVQQPAPMCQQHGAMTRFPPGISTKNNKPYNASWRCDVRDCPTKPVWDKDAA